LYSDCPSLKQYGKHQFTKGSCRHCGCRQEKKTYQTFLGAANSTVLKIGERSPDWTESFYLHFRRDTPSDVYETKAYDELSGETMRLQAPTARLPGAGKLRDRQHRRLLALTAIKDRVVQMVDERLVELLERLRGAQGRLDTISTRNLTVAFLRDVALFEGKYPTPKQLEQVFAAVLYYLSPEIREEDICQRYEMSKSTLQTWKRILDDYVKGRDLMLEPVLPAGSRELIGEVAKRYLPEQQRCGPKHLLCPCGKKVSDIKVTSAFCPECGQWLQRSTESDD
jgi:hypothetical protein